jgi:hypothetical protein
MANDFERRIERLEQASQRRLRPLLKMFDARDYENPEAEAAAYVATTPESEQAEYIIVINDPIPRGELHGAARYTST